MTNNLLHRLFLAALLGVSFHTCAADYTSAMEALLKGDFASAKNEFNALAGDGDSQSQYMLSVIYANGYGVPRDYGTAITWLRKSALGGYPNAQSLMGSLLLDGSDVPVEYYSAIQWQGVPIGANGDMSIPPRPPRATRADYQTAAGWLARAAAQNDLRCGAILSWMFANGRGVPVDHGMAYALAHLFQENELAKRDLGKYERSMSPAEIEAGRQLTAPLRAAFLSTLERHGLRALH